MALTETRRVSNVVQNSFADENVGTAETTPAQCHAAALTVVEHATDHGWLDAAAAAGDVLDCLGLTADTIR